MYKIQVMYKNPNYVQKSRGSYKNGVIAGLPIKNSTAANFNAEIESDIVLQSVKKEFISLKRQCQRSTYQFLTNATIDRRVAESPTLTIVFKTAR